jgi:hypothetical protein
VDENDLDEERRSLEEFLPSWLVDRVVSLERARGKRGLKAFLTRLPGPIEIVLGSFLALLTIWLVPRDLYFAVLSSAFWGGLIGYILVIFWVRFL